jgi:hypothetical protein
MSTTTLDLTSTVNRLLVLADRIERGELPLTTVPAAAAFFDPPATEPTPPADLPTMTTAEPAEPAVVLVDEIEIEIEAEIEADDVPTLDASPAAVVSSLPPPPIAPPAPIAPPVVAERPYIPTPPTIIVPAPVTRTAEIEVPVADTSALATIDELRATIDHLSGRKLGPRSRRKLVEALAQERAVLDELGCDSYLDLMLRKAAGSAQTSPLATPASPSAGISIQTGWLGDDRVETSFDVAPETPSDGEIDADEPSEEPADAFEVVASPGSACASPTTDAAPPTLASFNWPAMAAPTVVPVDDPALANSGA